MPLSYTKPYISITDFAYRHQATAMLDVFRRAGGPALGRKLGVGVMMSHKTLHGLPSKWTGVFPKKETVGDIFLRDDDALNTLHYADYDHSHGFAGDLNYAHGFVRTTVDACQLDMVWPDPAELGLYRSAHWDVPIILQVSAKALDAVDNDRRKLVARLGEYAERDCIDYVLLDKSMGRGLGLDAAALLPFARAISDSFPDIRLVAAGGLGPDSLHLVEPLVREFPDISIDAQSKLRSSGNAMDPIGWNMAADYLKRAVELLAKYRT